MPLGNPIRKQNESRMVSVLATEGQTVFSVQGGYIINHISVFRNGVRLSPAEDFTAGDGSTVTLNNEANVDDRIEFHIFDRFTVQNAIVGAASSQTISGDLVINGKVFGNLQVSNVNTGIVTATELDVNGKGDISGDLNVAGVSTFAADISIADKIIHTGDTDTTIRFPSADTIRFDTGGAEAARITSEQKFVIGDTNSTAQLGVIRDSYNLAEFTNTNADATGAELSLRKDSASPADNDSLGSLNFIGDNDAGQKTTYAYIQSKSTDVSDGTEDATLQFNTRGGGTLAERLRIDSVGNIGINESSPSHKLVVGGDIGVGFNTPNDAARQLNFNVNRGSAGQTLANINWQWNSKYVAQIRGMAGADTTNKDDAHLVFFTSAANNLVERLRITSDGKIGIGGETSPEYKVTVYDAGYSGVTIKTNRNTATDNIGGLHFKTQSTNVAYFQSLVDGTLKFRNSSSLTERMRITAAGKVGIGTDMAGTPASSYGFGVYRASGTGYLYTETAQSSASAGLRAKAGAADFTIFTTEGTGQLSIYDNTNTDERVRLTSAGTFNIGNSLTQTSRLFTVENTLASGGEIAYIGNNDGSNNYGGLVISAGETDRECRLESAWGNSFMTFYTNSGSATEKMRLTAGGRLGLGTNSPDELLHLKSTASAGACIELDNNNNYKSQIKTSSDAMEIRAPQSMNFYTGNNDGASSTIRMALKNTGGLEHYSSSDAVQNFKFRSDDVNWHGYLNQTVHGSTISTIIANSGQWNVDGTTYTATKDYNGAASSGAFIIHNQYSGQQTNATFKFLSKASGSSTTDGAISTYYTINYEGKHYFGDSVETLGSQDSNKFVFAGTKQYSGGIVQQQLAVVDTAAYNTTDNGGTIAFQAKYNSSGNYTQMASCGGLKANNTSGNYGGKFQIKVRNHLGNSIEYVDIQPTRSRFINSITTESEFNMTRDDGTPGNKYMDVGYLSNTFHLRRTNGGDGGHLVQLSISSNGTVSATAFNPTSDEKRKQNITSIADGSLALVKQLRPVTFDWIDSTYQDNQTGFIAQEVKAVIPNLVDGEEYDETKVNEKGQIISTGYSINTTGIVAHLTKALQELSAKNDALEARIAALEGS